MIDNLIYDTLDKPLAPRAYYLSRELAMRFPDRCVYSVSSHYFEPAQFAAAGNATMAYRANLFQHRSATWHGLEHGVRQSGVDAWYEVTWNGARLEIMLVTWLESHCDTPHYWILAESEEMARGFFAAVCEWNSEVRGEVLVFDGGTWYKDEELYGAIQSATFDNLVLPACLKQEIQDDFAAFFGSRATYERYRIPWKRGVILIGPPGNGKTHTVKALINRLGVPCLYVKSLKAQYQSDQDCIRSVFQRARQTTPCLLVMEDLDSLITDRNRSFFLNELDGFAANTGIVVIATTNHPERLDPALIDRPSRFDRKYRMDLPAADERREYITAWNGALETELRLTEQEIDAVVEATTEFSFAYIKELFLSSLMRWISSGGSGRLASALVEQSVMLREQMIAAQAAPDPPVLDDSPFGGDYDEE
ncbi:MAG TPA: ATP-binding protein [Chthonomonadaceae bacterium]|nr:ATP-binding protein [Chthonomonadaceae bacterium]